MNGYPNVEPFYRSLQLSAAAVNPVADFTLDPSEIGDRYLLVHALCAIFGPGAAQNVQEGNIKILPRGTGPMVLKGTNAVAAANVTQYVDYIGKMLLPPQSVIRANGVFNAGAAANSSTIVIVGLLIPRDLALSGIVGF